MARAWDGMVVAYIKGGGSNRQTEKNLPSSDHSEEETELVEVVSVRGTIDTHIHPAPCIYDRVGTEWEIALACKKAGMRAIAIKSHHEPTVSRADAVNRRMREEDPDSVFEVFGGVTLNSYIGGINPKAVEIALKKGGRFIWMPTVEAKYHCEIAPPGGLTKGMQVESSMDFDGITVKNGARLIPEAVDIVKLAADYKGIIGASHVSEEEILMLAEECAKRGASFVVNHPYWLPRTHDLAFYRKAVELGAYLELCAVFCSSGWPYTSFEENINLINEVGKDHVILATDAGNVFASWPHESLRVYLQNLHKLGMSLEDLQEMSVVNPARILGLEVTP